MLERLFKLKEHHTNVKTEVVAGITTFMTMAYICENRGRGRYYYLYDNGLYFSRQSKYPL